MSDRIYRLNEYSYPYPVRVRMYDPVNDEVIPSWFSILIKIKDPDKLEDGLLVNYEYDIIITNEYRQYKLLDNRVVLVDDNHVILQSLSDQVIFTMDRNKFSIIYDTKKSDKLTNWIEKIKNFLSI